MPFWPTWWNHLQSTSFADSLRICPTTCPKFKLSNSLPLIEPKHIPCISILRLCVHTLGMYKYVCASLSLRVQDMHAHLYVWTYGCMHEQVSLPSFMCGAWMCVCMCASVSLCVCVCEPTYVQVHKYVWMRGCIYVCLHLGKHENICTRLITNVWMPACVCVCACMYTRIHPRSYVCKHVCINAR